MKTKFITAIVAFSTTFVLSVLLIGVPKENFELQGFATRSSQTKQSISSLLRRDISNGRERDRKINEIYQSNQSEKTTYTSAEYAEIINEYVSASEKLDDTNLPPDFRFAWQNHMKIWREHADFLNQMEEISTEQKIGSDKFFQVFSYQDDEITDTWREVVLTGRKYGIYVSFYN
jgi:hypothetical protein